MKYEVKDGMVIDTESDKVVWDSTDVPARAAYSVCDMLNKLYNMPDVKLFPKTAQGRIDAETLVRAVALERGMQEYHVRDEYKSIVAGAMMAE